MTSGLADAASGSRLGQAIGWVKSAAWSANSAAVAVTAPTEKANSGRDHRVDLVRGLALTVIFINHMPGNWIGDWTPRNFGFSDAAEAFVLMAGFAAAMAYGTAFARGDRRGIVVKALNRAGVLYAGHLVTTLAAFVLFWSVITMTRDPRDLDLIGMAPIVADPTTSLMALLIGGFQLSYFNILPLYVVLLLMLPVLLILAGRDLRLVAAVSGALYLLTSLSGVKLPSMRDFDSWYFNPIAWQVLFCCGLIVGLRVRRGQGVAYHWAAYLVALAYVLFAAVWRLAWPDNDLGEGVLPYWVGSLQKPNLPLPRLLHVLALAYVLCHSRVWSWLAKVPSGFVLTRMGRHSLPIFMVGSLLSMSGWLLMTETGCGTAGQTGIVVAGFLVMSALATWLDSGLRLAVPRAPVFRNLAFRNTPATVGS